MILTMKQAETIPHKRRMRDPALDEIVPRRPPTVLSGPMSMMDYSIRSPRVLEYHLRGKLEALEGLMGQAAELERGDLGPVPTEKAEESFRMAMRLARYILRHTKMNYRRLDFPGIEMLSCLKEALSIDRMCGAPAKDRNPRLPHLLDEVALELEKRIEIACV